jgi:N-acetylglucosamine-6-sulfatase
LEGNYRHYCEALVAVDRELGRLLVELERLGLADDTVVVLASDNGYSWGEHRITGKRLATEENMRIPLIARYPNGVPEPGRRREQMALNIDLAPTLLDLAGVPIPDRVQGRSLKPLLTGAQVPWRESFLYEYFKDFPYSVPAHRAVRSQRYLYLEFEKRFAPQLYDILADPRTLENIIATPEGQQALPEMRAHMRTLLRAQTEGL